ncbi:tRNA (N(6)-L-threonylcarbamoyladenosine(37)-C(2))-methylthiotransferase [Candidatus Bathyarchaeota archaeon]|nr:tRNA (N(6)-L-threonylcarbamoyladenosine(37)-C(2))-methylthiotransferase [Candidatus Bathyarchaeota archaeon]
MAKVYMEVYGCSANVADAEVMLGLLKSRGYEIVKDPEKADVNIVATCTVKTPTEHRMIHVISSLSKLEKPLIVAGCMPLTSREAIERINPKASLLGARAITRIVDAVETALHGGKFVKLIEADSTPLCKPRVRLKQFIGIIPIAQGCLGKCSFCQVKIARGILRSYPPDLIIEEVLRALEHGCKEIWLSSQDNGCYGIDIGLTLADLLEKILKIEKDFKIRIGMMNPVHIQAFIDRILDLFSDHRIFKFAHIPVQSGSDKILNDMRRGYTVADAEYVMRKFRSKYPELSLITDIIVGYPTESEEDFEDTLNFIKRVEPDHVNVSKFGARPKTEAYKLKPLPPMMIKKRVQKLSELYFNISYKRNLNWLNWVGEAIVEEQGLKPGSWIARNHAYKPIVVLHSENVLGEMLKIKIVKAYRNFLQGEILN